RRLQLEVVEAVHRLHVDPALAVVRLDVEGNDRTGAALPPDLAIEFRQRPDRNTADPENDVATREPGLPARPLWTDTDNHQAPVLLLGVETEPWLRRAGGPASCQQVGHNRSQRVDWNEHVAWLILA